MSSTSVFQLTLPCGERRVGGLSTMGCVNDGTTCDLAGLTVIAPADLLPAWYVLGARRFRRRRERRWRRFRRRMGRAADRV